MKICKNVTLLLVGSYLILTVSVCKEKPGTGASLKKGALAYTEFYRKGSVIINNKKSYKKSSIPGKTIIETGEKSQLSFRAAGAGFFLKESSKLQIKKKKKLIIVELLHGEVLVTTIKDKDAKGKKLTTFYKLNGKIIQPVGTFFSFVKNVTRFVGNKNLKNGIKLFNGSMNLYNDIQKAKKQGQSIIQLTSGQALRVIAKKVLTPQMKKIKILKEQIGADVALLKTVLKANNHFRAANTGVESENTEQAKSLATSFERKVKKAKKVTIYYTRLGKIKAKNQNVLDKIELSDGRIIRGAIIDRGLMFRISTPNGVISIEASSIVSQEIIH